MQTQNFNPLTHFDNRFDEIRNQIESLQRALSKTRPQADPHERLTRAEIRKQYKVSLGTIHNAMNSKKLPFDKVGRKTLFKRVDVESWINKKA